MHYIVPVHVVQGAQKLIGVQLGEERMGLLTKFLEMLLHTVDIGWDIIHDDVQEGVRLLIFSFFVFFLVFFFFLLRFRGRLGGVALLVHKVGVAQAHDILMVHLAVDLKLPTFVSLILFDFLDCDDFASAL
mmetsp:Transcript_41832/g.55149  ORF Transcript_41832/g.55149 Transcript_41832/m.55149 type:complete len:131 (-) Transcript_41832:284-676(-)